MAVVEYLKSLLFSVGLTPERVPLAIGIVALVLAAVLAKPFFRRVGRVVEELFFSNWQLALLGATGLVLSLASGWTTWDGMRNFTGEPILSAMVTFGIQGVMLIVAWLIGESFASGMNQQMPSREVGDKPFRDDAGLKLALGFVLAGIATSVVGGLFYISRASSIDMDSVPRALGYIGLAVLMLGVLIVAARAHTLRSYFDATRVMVRTAVLWVMFLACMATSVFFSFDSLFSTIFPQSERARAAELRAQNQVAGIVSDIGNMISKSQLAESERLFSTEGWKAYDTHLANLGRAAQASQGEIERYFQTQMEDRRRGIAQQQERIATAQSGQAGLSQKKISLTDELSRLKGERPQLAEDFGKRKGDVEQINKDLDAKRVEAMAEARGVEGTGKVGEGPMFRQRKSEEAAARDKLKIAEERLKDAQKRYQVLESRLTQIERELSVIDGDIAKLKGETQTAEQRIKLAEEAKAGDEGPKLDPARVLPMFEKARVEFRQSPKVELLGQVQQMCAQLYGAMISTPSTKERVRGIDCDPKSAAEAAGRVFALNAGVLTFGANCAGGDKLANYKSADELFGFSRKCVQDSGLGSKETEELRQKINFIELNRDDKANRFVVTWNAFQDGNRLAYLALAIAIAIDSLVFMSGLFGANAVRSPLSDVPSTKARSAEQLEGIIESALLPDKFSNARIVQDAMHPTQSGNGFTQEVFLNELDPTATNVVRNVLNAGATIGAVKRGQGAAHFLVRSELHEFLSDVIKREQKRNKVSTDQSMAVVSLEREIHKVLLPEVGLWAETVLHYMHPINNADGFSSEIVLEQVRPEHVLPVRNVLNVGAHRDKVRRDIGAGGRYEVHGDIHSVLTTLRAREYLTSSRAALQVAAGRSIDGGLLGAGLLQGGAPQQIQIGHRDLSAPERRQAAQDANAIANPAAGSVPRLRPTTVTVTGPGSFDDDLAEHFAREMNLQTQMVTYLRDQSALIDIAGLQRSLDAVMMQDEVLRRILKQAQAGIEASIDEARHSFTGLPNGPVDGPLALNSLADVLEQMVPVILLSPGLAYDNVINKMEAELSDDEAGGRLDAFKAKKLKLVVDHRSELARAKYSDDHWRSVQKSLQRFATGLATLAGADQKPARMS